MGANMRLSVTAHGAVSVFNTDVLVGVMDLDTIQINTGMLLFAATRGDGWLSVFDLGASGGDTQQIDGWSIASVFLQLESTDIEIRQASGGGYDLFLAGLNDAALQSVGVTLGLGPDTFGPASGWSTDGFDAGDITEMALWDDGSGGLVAARGGGLEHLTFATGGDLHRQTISQGVDMDGRSATDIVTATQNGTEVAFVSYGSTNVVSLFRMADDDTMQHVADVGADDGLWAERPGAMAAVTGPDGELYIVVTASLSGSLSVLSVDVGADGLRVVDHVLDTRNTRFEDASYVSALTIGGQDYIVAAGTDSGMSLFVMLGGGRLQHVGTVAGSIGSPLHGISNIEAVDTDTGARIFVTTQGAPFLVEYSVALDAQGVTQMAGQNGGDSDWNQR